MASAFFRLFTKGYSSNFPRIIVKKFSLRNKLCVLTLMQTQQTFFFKSQLRNRNRKLLIASSILTWFGLKEKEEEDVMITTIKRGLLCLQREEYDKAETILHIALKVAQERHDMQAQRYIFDILANAALNKGDLPKSEKLFKQVAKELVASGTSTEDNSIVEISLKLATIYSEMKDDLKAEEGFFFCISTQEEKLESLNLDKMYSLSEKDKDTAILWAMSVDFYAKHLFARKSFKAAEINFQKALSVSEKLLGASHPQTLLLINNLGSVATMQKDYDKAIEYFHKAVKRTDASSENLPVFYCNLGATYFHKGNSKEAAEACNTALKLAKSWSNAEAEAEAKECLKDINMAKK